MTVNSYAIHNRINVGICSIGSGVGQSVIDSCRLSSLPLYTIGLGTNLFAFGLYECDDFAILPSYYSDEYLGALLKICQDKNIHIVIPGHDDEAQLIASNLEMFTVIGVEVVVSSRELIDICRAKETMPREFPTISDLFVKSYTYQEALEALKEERLIFPLISKPRDGFASKGIFIVNDREDLVRSDADSILQEVAMPHSQDPHRQAYLKNLQRGNNSQVAEISVQLICDKNGHIQARCATYNKLNNGVPIEILPYQNEDVDEAVNRLIPYLVEKGLRGPINVQGRLTDNGFKVFELNPRFTGITGLRASMGFNEVAACIKHWCMNEPLLNMSLNKGVFGIRQTVNKALHISRNDGVLNLYQSIHKEYPPKNSPLILVTGSTGSIGRLLIKKLLQDKVYHVWTLDRDANKAIHMHDNENVRCFNWEDLKVGRIDIGSVDKLVHLATARPFHPQINITESFEKGMELFTKFAMHASGEIIFASSQSVYGHNPEFPWLESLNPQPSDYYAQSKYMLELHLKSLKQLKPDLSYQILRISAVTGNDETIKKHEMLARIVEKAKIEGVINISGGHQVLGRIDVRDVVDAFMNVVADTTYNNADIYNLGMAENVSLIELANIVSKKVSEKTGNSVNIVVTPNQDAKSHVVDSSKFNKKFNWHANYTFEEIVKSLL